jgi:hypothetical protein
LAYRPTGVRATQRDLCKTAGYACGPARRDAARACGQAVTGVPGESGRGDVCRASVILARAQRREAAARDARVQRWAEDNGNAALMGRELPPAEVLAADQRITAWARELKKAGLDGDMDQLRPAPTWTCCWAKTPGPALTIRPGTRLSDLMPARCRPDSPGGST